MYPETSTYSTCGCQAQSETKICENLSPTFRDNYPPSDPAKFVEESQMYFDGITDCDDLFGTNTNSNCPGVSWNYEYNWAVDSCIGKQNIVCSTDSDDNRDDYIGSISEPSSTSGKPKVTVWYNNQVCKLTFNCSFFILIVFVVIKRPM